jgi:methyl-accepting chemotaxis protein
MIDIQSWKSQVQDLETNLNQCEQRLTGPRKQERDKRQIKQRLAAFQQSFDELDSYLTQYTQAPHKYNLTKNDIDFFISKINSVRNKIETVNSLCNRTDENMRTALLGDGSRSSGKQYQDDSSTVDLTNQQLYSQHQQRRAAEDDKLDNISAGLTQLTDIANDQNKKLQHHDVLLNDLHQNVDNVDDSMRSNIQRADIVEERSRGGWLAFFLMIILLVLIVIVITTKWFCFLPNTTRNCPRSD